jgi:hypothetical protein
MIKELVKRKTSSRRKSSSKIELFNPNLLVSGMKNTMKGTQIKF